MIELLTTVLDKMFWGLFVFSILGVIRFLYLFVGSLTKTPPEQLILTRFQLITLGGYLAFIIMCIITGIKL